MNRYFAQASLLLCVLLLALSGCGKQQETKPADAAPPAATTPATNADAKSLDLDAASQKEIGLEFTTVAASVQAASITANGQLAVNEDLTTYVGSLTAGKVAEINAKVGDLVREDQVLARMHSHDVHESRAAYQEARYEYDRRATLASQALRVRDRAKRLFELKAVSREQMEAAETEYENAQIALRNAASRIEKERIHLTEILEVPIENAQSPKVKDHHADDLVPVRAPSSGTIIERYATPGQVVSPGDKIFAISDLSRLWMLASVNEVSLDKLRIGQRVRITVNAYPGRGFPGQVIKLGEKMDATTRTLQVRIEVPNAGNLLKPEMFANVEIAGGEGRPMIRVPETAVHEVNGHPVVFVRTAGKHFEAVRVGLGESADGQREIVSGLRSGDEIVVKGAFSLKSELLKEKEQ